MSKVLNRVTPFPHSIYGAIIKPIRDADADENFFLKRFLDGPQEVWETLYAKIGLMAKIQDPNNTPANVLPLLKQLVGFTGQFDSLTSELDEATLRKLLRLSIPIWRERGTEAGLVSVVRVLIQTEPNLFNWFFHHFIIDEVVLGEEWEGFDPWILEGPEDSVVPFESRLMIFDPGTVDRDLLLNVLNLFRVPSERIDVTYHPFMEDWDLDWGQWESIGNDPNLAVDAGIGQIRPTTSPWAVVTSPITDQLDDHSVRWKFAFVEIPVGAGSRTFLASRFLETSPGNWAGVGVRFNYQTDTITFGTFTFAEGGPTLTFTPVTDYPGWHFAKDTFYTFTIEMEDDGTDLVVQFFSDRNFVFRETIIGGASTYPNGGAAMLGRTLDLDFDFVHVTPIPVDSDRVEPS
jgi:phage tail-like protein